MLDFLYVTDSVFCYNFNINHKGTFLLHFNTPVCVKAEAHAIGFTLLINCAESLRHSNVYVHILNCAESLRHSNVYVHILFMNTKRTQLHNINFITCFKA